MSPTLAKRKLASSSLILADARQLAKTYWTLLAERALASPET
ncbi:hypothetical protein A2U01_0089533 [Trifolium medium]|uniref:Uncharacterized protein n=1 Tax=Trifolium medium TaxID=97028 RepID=A0A392U482_9FABA|nr:hypothetical protein [Trifolium medium]